jgi:hypothetical protein
MGTLLAILALCSVLAFAGYTYGHDRGYFEGEKTGMDVGYNKGFGEGQDKGYADGYQGGQQAGYQAGYDVGLKESLVSGSTSHNPTYQEMKEFLAQDRTNTETYISGQYVCSDFATEVNNNAEDNDIRCAVVEIRFVGSDIFHEIVAFETTDKGLIFIEPHLDKEVIVQVGQSYSKSNSIIYGTPIYNDIISRILIAW